MQLTVSLISLSQYNVLKCVNVNVMNNLIIFLTALKIWSLIIHQDEIEALGWWYEGGTEPAHYQLITDIDLVILL